jgi:hypothetical protein
MMACPQNDPMESKTILADEISHREGLCGTVGVRKSTKFFAGLTMAFAVPDVLWIPIENLPSLLRENPISARQGSEKTNPCRLPGLSDPLESQT